MIFLLYFNKFSYLILFATIISILNTEEILSVKPKLFPNPATNELNIYSDELQVDGVKIYNVLGNLVLSYKLKGKSNIKIDISLLNPGVYFVKIFSNKVENVSKFVKQ